MNNLTLAEAAEDVVRRIESLGVRCEANSRFRRGKTIFAKGFIEPDDPDHAAAIESIRDVRVMHFALCELMGKVPDDILRGKVRRVIKDECSPRNESDKSPGRDIQAELHVAAVCANAGMQPAIEEPDVMCHVQNECFGIAVKRLKSRSQFEKKFRKGAGQIRQAGIKGIIAMDMSVAFNRQNRQLMTNGDNRQIQLARQQLMRKYVDPLHEKMKVWLAGREVRGLILIDHIISYDKATKDYHLDTHSLGVSFAVHKTPHGAFVVCDERGHREFEGFWHKYQKGIPNLQSS